VTSPADAGSAPTPTPPPRPDRPARTFHEAIARVVASDARYDFDAYQFLFEALEYTRTRRDEARLKEARSGRRKPPAPEAEAPFIHHLTGRELSEGARDLALTRYGPLAAMILAGWGVRSTSDLGNIVYNLIASGEMEKTPEDAREDFDDVYDFADAFAFSGFITEDEPET
jgi:uncharacterized repeat protein (TIGR04138 family)